MNKAIYTLLVLITLSISTSSVAYFTEVEAAADKQQLDAEKVKLVQTLQKEALDSSKGRKTAVDASPVSASLKLTNTRKHEPAKALVPKRRERAKLGERERRFAELKHSLRGPEGLLHLPKLEIFVKHYPDHLQARLWLIRSQLMAQQEDNALNSIGEPGSWQDPDWQVSYWKAQVYLHHGQLGSARRAMDYALSNMSGNADIWVQQAVLEQETNNHDGAVQLLKIALEVNPANAIAQLNLGFSLEHLSQYQAALKAYRKYLSNGDASNSTLRLKVLKRVELLARYNSQHKRDNSTNNLSTE
ncbi:MAG: tetratricopeptide repeat protein [Granulosicoccaceae bacterium]